MSRGGASQGSQRCPPVVRALDDPRGVAHAAAARHEPRCGALIDDSAQESQQPVRQQKTFLRDKRHQHEDAGEDEEQRQIGALLDQHRAQEVVQAADDQAPDQQENCPAGIAAPEKLARPDKPGAFRTGYRYISVG